MSSEFLNSGGDKIQYLLKGIVRFDSELFHLRKKKIILIHEYCRDGDQTKHAVELTTFHFSRLNVSVSKLTMTQEVCQENIQRWFFKIKHTKTENRNGNTIIDKRTKSGIDGIHSCRKSVVTYINLTHGILQLGHS